MKLFVKNVSTKITPDVLETNRAMYHDLLKNRFIKVKNIRFETKIKYFIVGVRGYLDEFYASQFFLKLSIRELYNVY